MCGRYYLAHPADDFKETFSITTVPPITPRYNLAPSQSAPIARLDKNQQLEAVDMRWGLVPFWAKDPAIGNRLINARSESAHDKPAFREAFKNRRCIVLASGFYEWEDPRDNQPRQPHAVQRSNHQPLAFAGLYERWHDPEQPDDTPPLRTFTILTMNPCTTLAHLHDRQPVMLTPALAKHWLNDAALPAPSDTPALELWPVSRRVNTPNNDTPDLLQPLDENNEDQHDTRTPTSPTQPSLFDA